MNTWALGGLALAIAATTFIGGLLLARGGVIIAAHISDQRAHKRHQLAEDEGESHG